MKRVLVCLLMLSSSAIAQEQGTPRERALMERIGGEVNGSLVCSANVIALQDKIKELEAKLKEAPK